ncbi:ER degradation-enhancing alpha-mannosidase-like protein 3 isoform X3 [Varroa destructor]|uniref:alpha-1,2-Mannosidase n=2 Tax=Varroa destructor TaxID=109461 RepID=A0A7M7JXA3_VARDE|nr:ER degradation-enhancing alpha-mannosidase-like protein 3 isoform X3 [Varroa destructor]
MQCTLPVDTRAGSEIRSLLAFTLPERKACVLPSRLDILLVFMDQVKEMFLHGYNSYMAHAFPADELMPLSCKGRFRGVEENRGDIDDALGNFSLTLVDSADTLVILGELDEFERAVKLIIENVRVDNDVVVSVFETNIRMLGGLLSNHILTKYLQETRGRMPWYNGELLVLAKELGLRLLPSFNSTTGIPHPRINLRWGMKSPSMPKASETCTACAGTMLLELAALSRLTGESVFEAKARKAMDYLWLQRHRSSDLVGTVINVNSGDWVRRDSGVGAGIDSYYEYCLKGYILLGEDAYLERFERHYAAVMKYISQGPMLVDVHMHRPTTNAKNFMDALLAFWPGLQVLKGDIKPAIETHEMLYQVMQRHNFLPEAFTTDFQVHWGQHPLRPEFIESTYFLYKATDDPYYLEVGRRVVDSLQSLARVPCGFAAVKDVRTGSKDDRMDSFVLAETFKYLYLLFADKADVPLAIDQFIFTTEAHLLPLSLSQRRPSPASTELNTTASLAAGAIGTSAGVTLLHSRYAADTAECPNSEVARNADKVRLPLKNLVEDTCPSQPVKKRRLLASQFDVSNPLHVQLARQMGVQVAVLGDGRMQLVHNAAHAASSADGQEGLLFMHEMIQLAKQTNSRPETEMRSVQFMRDDDKLVVIPAGPAQFGPDLGNSNNQVSGEIVLAAPPKVCHGVANCAAMTGRIALLERGDCMFIEKARHVQRCGAIGAIVLDTAPDTSARAAAMFAMSGDGGQDDPSIPVLFLFSLDAKPLLEAIKVQPKLQVTLGDAVPAGPVLPTSGGSLTSGASGNADSTDGTVARSVPGAGDFEADLNKLLQQIHNLQASRFPDLSKYKDRLKKLLLNILVRQSKDFNSALAKLGMLGVVEPDDPLGALPDACDPHSCTNPAISQELLADYFAGHVCQMCPLTT